jgi:predicted DNA-binding protein
LNLKLIINTTMGRPKIKQTEKRVTLCISIAPETLNRLLTYVDNYGRSKSASVETALNHYFNWCDSHPLVSKSLSTNSTQTPKI